MNSRKTPNSDWTIENSPNHRIAINEKPLNPKGWFRWKNGRLNGGYKVFTFFSIPKLDIDLHLIYMPCRSEIPRHLDPVLKKGFEHHRVNIILWRPKDGGHLIGYGLRYRRVWPFFWYKFRPDIIEHSVTKIYRGSRLVLSFGWLRKSAINGEKI